MSRDGPGLWGDEVNRRPPVRESIPGPAAGADGQGELGRLAVRVLDVLAGEVVLAAHEDRATVVAPARPEGGGSARIVQVLGEAVLRRLAEGGDVDGGLQERARRAGQAAERGAGEEASVVGSGRPAVTVQREGHDGPAVAGSGREGREFQFLVHRRDVRLAGQAEPPGLVETARADNPVGSTRMCFGGVAGLVRLHGLGSRAGPQLAIPLRGLHDIIAVGGDTAQRAVSDLAELRLATLVAERYRPGPLRGEE